MEKKALGPKVGQVAFDFLKTTWGKPNRGATYILEAFPGMFMDTIREMKGIFSDEELCLILDSMHKCELSAHISGSHLTPYLLDAIFRDRLEEKWKVDAEMFMDKIYKLKDFQEAILEIWAKRYLSNKKTIGMFEYIIHLKA